MSILTAVDVGEMMVPLALGGRRRLVLGAGHRECVGAALVANRAAVHAPDARLTRDHKHLY